MLLNCSIELDIVVDPRRINECRTQKSVIPVEDNRSFILLRLLLGCQPDLFIGQLTHEILSKFVVSPTF